MIAWRTLACSAAVLCLASAGCGDDGELTTAFSGPASGQHSEPSSGSGSSGSSSSSSSSGTSDTSGLTTSLPTTNPDPTTGNPDLTTTTTNGTTSWQTTGDDTTTDTSGSTGNATNATTMTNPGGCGDGEVGPNEQCDGANLNGFDCVALGNAGGTLACDPVTCTFDTSMCMGNGSGGTSG